MKIIPFSQFTDGDTEGQKARGSYLDCGEKLSRPGLRGGSGGKNERNSCRLHTRLGMQPTQQDNTVEEGMDPKPGVWCSAPAPLHLSVP